MKLYTDVLDQRVRVLVHPILGNLVVFVLEDEAGTIWRILACETEGLHHTIAAGRKAERSFRMLACMSRRCPEVTYLLVGNPLAMVVHWV